VFRSVSTEVPATPVTRMMLPPLSPSLSTRNCASVSPNLTWSVLTWTPHSSVTVLSNDTTRMSRSQACFTTPLRPVGEAALMMIASTRWEIRFEICCDCLDTSLPELKTGAVGALLPALGLAHRREVVDHLDAPLVADVGVRQRDLVLLVAASDAVSSPPPPDEPPQPASSSAAAMPTPARVAPGR
jgi:hypothetical protein